MINRISDRSNSKLTGRNLVRPFNFSLKQQRAFADDLERDLKELERRFTSNFCALAFDQRNAQTRTDASDGASDTCTYDDFGLVEGVEIDVNWM